MELKDFIKYKRKELNLTLLDVAKACGVSEGTVSRWESGDIDDMKRSRIAALSKILKISPSIIVGYEDDTSIYEELEIDYLRVPLYMPICCGDGGFVEDQIIEYVPVPSKNLSSGGNYFCQIAEGESMKDAGISEGDLLVFEKTSKVESGTIGCFCVDDNMAMCKKYKTEGSFIMLQPMNSEFSTIPVDPSCQCFKCLGILKKVIKDYDWEN